MADPARQTHSDEYLQFHDTFSGLEHALQYLALVLLYQLRPLEKLMTSFVTRGFQRSGIVLHASHELGDRTVAKFGGNACRKWSRIMYADKGKNLAAVPEQ